MSGMLSMDESNQNYCISYKAVFQGLVLMKLESHEKLKYFKPSVLFIFKIAKKQTGVTKLSGILLFKTVFLEILYRELYGFHTLLSFFTKSTDVKSHVLTLSE